MKTCLGRPLQSAIKLAIERPGNWDIPGILSDAVFNLDSFSAVVERIMVLSSIEDKSSESFRLSEINRLARDCFESYGD